MKFTVGGRTLDLTAAQVEDAMHGVHPEGIRQHLVEVHGTVFPPKQVLATVTGWERTSFTTMEAQRVLARLGFTCRRAGNASDGRPAWARGHDEFKAASPAGQGLRTEQRLASLEAALGTVQAAIAGLQDRVSALEGT